MLFDQLSKRGPDYSQLLSFDLELYQSYLFSSVLNIRSDDLIKQPIIKANDFLQFNGELYAINGDFEFDANSTVNDGVYLIEKLANCLDEKAILDAISSLRGEFSFIYWNSKLKTIYFGRDYFGRRSLCWNVDSKLFFNDELRDLKNSKYLDSLQLGIKPNSNLNISDLDFNLCVSSIAFYDDQQNWTEVPANGIFKICLSNKVEKHEIQLIEWQSNLRQFDQGKLKKLNSPIQNSFNFDLLDTNKINDDQIMAGYEIEFLKILRESVALRVLKQNFKCKNCTIKQADESIQNQQICSHSCLAVLFSGGLDSTILALLANEFMPKHLPIDLINLAFSEKAPDRLTGWNSFFELKRIAPERKWNFITIDKTPEQLVDFREKVIKQLIYPLNTVLDDSIGCALYFASTGKGKLIQDNLKIESTAKDTQEKVDRNVNELISEYAIIDYETTSKIYIAGQGADEQLSGYARHRTTFAIGGWSALQKEQNLDISRISSRNLGRDDRMISCNSREARYPFLDENVVSYLNSLPTNVKCDLNRPKGEGDKRLLRLIGKRLGLRECCKYEKRAIQFGTKIAKLENKKEKSFNISKRLV